MIVLKVIKFQQKLAKESLIWMSLEGIEEEKIGGIIMMMDRMRDLERKYIDLASSLDRRVQSFIEENPQKILRHLRV